MKKNKKDVIFLCPHTHYDAVWVFTKEDYFYINIELILKKAVELIEKTDDYKFLLEQTYLLEEVERRYPEIFKKLVKYVKEGRIEIADGEYLMADLMIPQGETLIREILVGKKYIKDKFGVNVKVMWQADSFGLNAQLPQIYVKSGYKYLAFRRGAPKNKPSEFLWEALDGSRILTHFMPLGYRAGLDLSKIHESYKKLKKLAATNYILMPSGSGVTLPQDETCEIVKKWNKVHKNSEIKISTPSEFFEKLEEFKDKLPVIKGEMYSGKYSQIFPDVASTRIWIKKNLRKYENRVLSFEKFSTINYLFTKNYPIELKNLWKKVLFLAFHDVTPGTGMDDCYKEVKDHIKVLETHLNRIEPGIFESIVYTDSDEKFNGDIVIFNPLSFPVKNWIEIEMSFMRGDIYDIEALESDGEEIEIEVFKVSRFEDDSIRKAKIGFIANVPSLGYRVYRILEKKRKKEKKHNGNYLRLKGNTIENKFFKVIFSLETGLIRVVKDGKEIFSGNEIVIDEEIGDLYHHKESFKGPLKTESGEGIKYGSFKLKDIHVKRNHLRAVIEVETEYYSLRWPYRLVHKLKPRIWRHKFLTIKKKIIIYRDLPRIDFVTEVENDHPRIRLRVRFKPAFVIKNYICESQFGAVKRKKDLYYFKAEEWREKPSGVYPSLRWIDVNDGAKGITVINKGNPENEVRDNCIYLTLLRGVDTLSSDGRAGPVIPVPEAMEKGKHIFEYAVYPHEGNWKKAKSYLQGWEFNQRLISLQLPRSKKYRVKNSFITITPLNVILSALKKSEEGRDIILRLYEAEGRNTTTKIKFFKKPKKVKLCNLLEEEINDRRKVKLSGKTVELNVKPFEILTLKIRF